jgi:hypothetical protein
MWRLTKATIISRLVGVVCGVGIVVVSQRPDRAPPALSARNQTAPQTNGTGPGGILDSGEGRWSIWRCPLKSGHYSSVDGCAAGPALSAVDEEAMYLIVLGVQQDRPAVAAEKINGVGAGDENRWRIHGVFEGSGFDYPQFSRWILHDLPV